MKPLAPPLPTDSYAHEVHTPKRESLRTELPPLSPLYSDIDIRSPMIEIPDRPGRVEASPRQLPRAVRSGLRLGFKKLYYNDFTTIDWVNSYIHRNKSEWLLLKSAETSFKGRAVNLLGKFQSYVLITLFALVFSLLAFGIDKSERFLVEFKSGYCTTGWLSSYEACCAGPLLPPTDPLETCARWRQWSEVLPATRINVDYTVFIILSVVLALFSVLITLTTKTATAADRRGTVPASTSYLYTAAGSGVPEVKTILLGFVIRKFLGTYTLVAKTVALVFAIALGMSLGKEGPYVHLATCVGNILCRFFPAIHTNEYRKKQILTAACSAGVALAFGSPLGGVLFTLEEINNYLAAKQLFKIFFCAVLSTLLLQILNPYGTGKAVLFAVSYTSEWKAAELFCFLAIGACGGLFGAAFVKFSRWWPVGFRTMPLVRDRPVREVALVALITAVSTFGNPYTIKPIPELMRDLATSCTKDTWNAQLCPTNLHDLGSELRRLSLAFGVKLILTSVTFGLKVPLGIYVPSMVLGALFGRVFALVLELLNYHHAPEMRFMCEAPGKGSTGLLTCVDLGIYALVAAGAFMAGVTRMNITLVVILFELTSSYNYVIPFSVAIAVSNWVATALEPLSLYESLLEKNNYPVVQHAAGPFDPLMTAADIIHPDDGVFHGGGEAHTDDLGGHGGLSNGASEPLIGRGKPYYGSSARLSRGRPRSTRDQDPSLPPSSGSPRPHPRSANRARPPLHATASAWLCHLSKTPQPNSYYHNMMVDVSASSVVPATDLHYQFSVLQRRGLIDGCIPILKNGHCLGLLPGPELEMQLDRLRAFCLEYNLFEEVQCTLDPTPLPTLKLVDSETYEGPNALSLRRLRVTLAPLPELDVQAVLHVFAQLTDITPIVDYNPIFINAEASLSLVELMFEKLGTRTLVLLQDGEYYGILHKKIFIDFCRRLAGP